MADPVVVFAIVEASAGDGNRVMSAVQLLARQSRREAGCRRYDIYLSRQAPVMVIIHETWDSDTALQAHRTSLHVERFKAAIGKTTATVWASPCTPLGEEPSPG